MWKRLLAIGIVLVSCMNTAFAQRDEAPRVPRPITDAQMQRWCDWLGVSDDQRHAIELEFEQYLDDFEPLRTEMSDAAVRNPRFSKSDLELVHLLPGFIARTQAADEALFARIDAVIIDAQRTSLQRIRLQRERFLLCDLQTIDHLIGDGIPDLRALLEGIDPPPEVLQPLSSSLDMYETRLTAGLHSMFDAVMRLCANPSAQSPYSRGSNAPLEPDFIKDLERVIAAVRDVRALNRGFFEATAPSLPEEWQQQWKAEFVMYAYGTARDDVRMWGLTTIQAALETPLADDQRQAVLALRAEAWLVQDQMLAKMMDALDQAAIGIAGPQGAVGNQELMNLFNDTRQDVMERDRKIRQALKDLLGADTVKQLQGQTPESSAARHAQSGSYSAYGLVSFHSKVMTIRPGRSRSVLRTEPLMPWPFEREELELWTSALAVQGDALVTINADYDAYRSQLDVALTPMQEQAFRNSPNVSIGGQAKDPFERARAAQDYRAKMRAAIDAADTEFLQQLRSVIGDAIDRPMWDRLLRLRQRALLGIDMSWAAYDNANVAGGIDLIQLLLQQRLMREEWSLIADAAAEYEGKVDPILKQQAESLDKTQYDQTAFRDGWRQQDRPAFRDDEGQNGRYGQVGDLNRATLDAIVVVLPPATGARVKDAFNRRAYPKAFDDPECMENSLRQAQALTDLTPTQNERLATIRVEFNDAYAKATAGLVELCAVALQFMPMAGRTITDDVAKSEENFNEEYARLGDAREEANRRALRGLRVALLPPQMRRITLPAQE